VNIAERIALNGEHCLLIRHALADDGRGKPPDLALIFERRAGLGGRLDQAAAFAPTGPHSQP